MGQCGGEEHQRRQTVDLILDDLAAEHDQPDQLHVDAAVGLHARRADARQAGLLIGEQAVGNGLADVQSEDVGCLRGHDELIRPAGVSHPALYYRRAILVEVKAVDAGGRVDLGEVVKDGGSVRAQRDGVDADPGRYVPDLAQLGDLRRQGR